MIIRTSITIPSTCTDAHQGRTGTGLENGEWHGLHLPDPQIHAAEARSTLLSYARKNSDAGMWLSLTKQHVLNPCDLLTQPFISPYRGWSLAAGLVF